MPARSFFVVSVAQHWYLPKELLVECWDQTMRGILGSDDVGISRERCEEVDVDHFDSLYTRGECCSSIGKAMLLPPAALADPERAKNLLGILQQAQNPHGFASSAGDDYVDPARIMTHAMAPFACQFMLPNGTEMEVRLMVWKMGHSEAAELCSEMTNDAYGVLTAWYDGTLARDAVILYDSANF